MNLNVLVLPSFYSHPGREGRGQFFRDQAKALAMAGVTATVAFVEPRSILDFSIRALRENHWQCVSNREHGIWTVRQKGWNPGLRTVTGGRIWASLSARLVNRNYGGHMKPDLIHAHNALYAGLAARSAARRLGIPYIVSEHSSSILIGDISPAERRIVKKVYRDAKSVIAVSNALARMVSTLTAAPATVVPNVLDTGFFVPPRMQRHRDRFSVLAVGNLIQSKGFDVLIRAFARQFSRRPDCELVIAGSGREKARLERLAEEQGVAPQIRFAGQLAREEVRNAMWNASVLAISSYYETFGVVAIEAIGTGLPVVSTRCGGPEDVIGEESGWLVPPGDPSALGQALLVAREQGRDLAPIRDRLIERFSMRSVANRLVSIYAD